LTALRATLVDRAARALDGAGLLRPAARARDRIWTRLFGEELEAGSGGLPVPPASLRAGVADRRAGAREFLRRGARAAATIRSAARSAGVELEGLEAMLDFGCGCGRVARYWSSLEGPEVHGCDLSPDAVRWCAENLGIDARVNGLEPPAPYPPETFDLIYALSVLTHLTEPLQGRWIAELGRIAKPGGLLVATTHGDAYRSALLSAERERYDRGEVVVKYPRSAGANACGAYHPPGSVKRLLAGRGWQLLSHEPAGAQGVGRQDLYVARRSDG
jgi:SAM-dependent methyltransferase